MVWKIKGDWCSFLITTTWFNLDVLFFARLMQESEVERRRQKREREGVNMLFSSTGCAHMYERRSIYFKTHAWVYTDLKHTHSCSHCRSGSSQNPNLPSDQACLENGWKDAFPSCSRICFFYIPKFSKCITCFPMYTHKHVHIL